jgi:hypothetical protein
MQFPGVGKDKARNEDRSKTVDKFIYNNTKKKSQANNQGCILKGTGKDYVASIGDKQVDKHHAKR